MMAFKYLKNNKLVGVSNIKTFSDDPEIIEEEISQEEFETILINEKEMLSEKITLENWFEGYYHQHEQKFRRLHTLGKLTDEGKNAYDALIELYIEAEIKRARIKELEVLLNG